MLLLLIPFHCIRLHLNGFAKNRPLPGNLAGQNPFAILWVVRSGRALIWKVPFTNHFNTDRVENNQVCKANNNDRTRPKNYLK